MAIIQLMKFVRKKNLISMPVVFCFLQTNENKENEELRIESDDDDDVGGCKNGGDDDVMDVEDMGDYVENNYSIKPKGPPKEMVTPLIRKSLEKQGYKLIGSHSGVKLCRWTKVIR